MTNDDIVRWMVTRLPPHQREVIELVDLQGYTLPETAKILGIALGTAKSRRGRAFTTMTHLWKTRTD